MNLRAAALLALVCVVLGGCSNPGVIPIDSGPGEPSSSLAPEPDTATTKPVKPSRRLGPLGIVAHRGGPASGQTENGLPAVRQAGAADMVEFDIRPAVDGGLVVLHDGGLARTSRCTGQVWTRTFDDLTTSCRLLDGSPLPSFADYAAAATEAGLPMMVELKSGPGWRPEVFREIRDVLEANGPTGEHVFLSFDQDLLDLAKAEMPTIPGIWIVPRRVSASPAVLKREVGGFLVDGELTTRSWVAQAHRQGQLVIGRVVDTAAGWEVCRERGLDSVLSNRLEGFVEWRGSRDGS